MFNYLLKYIYYLFIFIFKQVPNKKLIFNSFKYLNPQIQEFNQKKKHFQRKTSIKKF